jgi:peptidyl-prolyl cis-trans isomerase D
MFDLFRSRDKAVRILLGGILVLVSLSMLTYLIPSYNSGGADASDMVVATVGKDVITVPEVNKVIQVTMRGRQIPPSVLPSYIPQLVDQMVMDRALAYEAERLGFQVSDAELRDAIQQMMPDLFPDGKFVGREAYASFLAQQNVRIEEFEADVRRQMLLTRLRDVALEGTVVTPGEIEQEYRRKYEKIKVQYVKVSADRYKAEAQPTPQELQDYFKANAARYQVPEKKNLAILIADQAKLEQGLNPTDADLDRMYNQNKESFRTPERVRVRHILLKTMDKPATEDPKMKAQAEDLLKKIRGGANFSELAKKYSEDPTSAQNAKDPGELPDWIARGQMVPEFERVAFALKPGQTSDIVKTSFGYHIVQVMAHDDARLQPLSEVKDKLVAEWRKQRVNDILQNISDKAQGELQKDPAHPEKVATEFNMQLVRADGVAPNQALPEIGNSADFDTALMGLKPNEVSAPVALPGNKIAIAEVTGIIPARPATFEEVQDQVRNYMIQTRSTNALQRHVQELLEAAKKSGDLTKSAKAMGLDVKMSDAFSREGTAEGIGPASYLQEAFNRANGTVVGPYSVPEGTIVAQVMEHVAADMSKLAEERSAIRDDVKRRKAQDRSALFQEGIRSELKKQGKIKVNDAVIRRLIANYGSSS